MVHCPQCSPMSSFIPQPEPTPIVSYIERLAWRPRRPIRDTSVEPVDLGWTTDILDTYPPEAFNVSRNDDEWQLLIFRKGSPLDGKVVARVLGHYPTAEDAKAAAAAHIAAGPIPR